jgi:hypothetical protein
MKNLTSRGNPRAADQFALRITARLSGAVDDLPHDISERLRAARVQAVDKRKWVLTQTASEIFLHHHSGTLTAGHGHPHSSWWNRLGAVGLLLALVLGLLAINVVQDELGARELADIDAAILTDDLPPAAYVDPGFTQFLKSGNRQEQ